jgi:hypothetical protein
MHTLAAARFSTPKAFTTGSGMRSRAPPILKFCRDLCVCAPQYLHTVCAPQEAVDLRWTTKQAEYELQASATACSHLLCYHAVPSTKTPAAVPVSWHLKGAHRVLLNPHFRGQGPGAYTTEEAASGLVC